MKTLSSVLCFMLFVTFANKGFSQEKSISDQDKKEIIKLFDGVDKSQYRLQFNKGKEVYGARKVTMRELEQVRKIRNPGGDQGYVVLIVADDGIVYIVAVSKGGKLESVLGKEKTIKLNSIMAKYSR